MRPKLQTPQGKRRQARLDSPQTVLKHLRSATLNPSNLVAKQHRETKAAILSKTTETAALVSALVRRDWRGMVAPVDVDVAVVGVVVAVVAVVSEKALIRCVCFCEPCCGRFPAVLFRL